MRHEFVYRATEASAAYRPLRAACCSRFTLPLAARRASLHAEPVAALLFNARVATHFTKGEFAVLEGPFN
eukprot:2679163-Lingulodinium_polyedra.AAC.1